MTSSRSTFPASAAPPRSPGVTPTAAALADAIEGELDRLGVARFHVAGYSLGARVALELATRGRTLSVIAIAPDGLGTPLERVHQAAALLSGRTLARLLAPIATPLTATGAGRSLFFAMERSRPWQLAAEDAGQLLLDFAQAPGYLETVQAAMVDVPMRLDRITCLPGPAPAGDRRPVGQHAEPSLPRLRAPRPAEMAPRPQPRPDLR
jgi:pimeloyl-ACP methyl ester carboxylesterase